MKEFECVSTITALPYWEIQMLPPLSLKLRNTDSHEVFSSPSVPVFNKLCSHLNVEFVLTKKKSAFGH